MSFWRYFLITKNDIIIRVRGTKNDTRKAVTTSAVFNESESFKNNKDHEFWRKKYAQQVEEKSLGPRTRPKSDLVSNSDRPAELGNDSVTSLESQSKVVPRTMVQSIEPAT